MTEIITKARRFTLPRAVKSILLIIFSLLIFDVLVAVLGGPYLSENIGTFLGMSRTSILSYFLFEEGAVILAIGIFIAVAKAMKEIKPPSKPSTETTVNSEQTREKRINKGTLMIIIGTFLIVLSITVDILFR